MISIRAIPYRALGAALLGMAMVAGGVLPASARQAQGPYDVNVSFTSVAPNPAYIGQPVQVQAAVSAVDPNAGIPGGILEVQANQTQMCVISLDLGGQGACDLTFAQPAEVKLKAIYPGYNQYKPNVSAEVTLMVNDKYHPSLGISAHDPNPSILSRPIQVSATLTSSGPAPTGSVTIYRGGDTCSAADLQAATDRCEGLLSGSKATCDLVPSTAGTMHLCAYYAGDVATYPAFSEPVTHKVSASNTFTTITRIEPSPSLIGQTTWVYFTVTSPDGAPVGEVSVSSGASTCSGSVADGRCQLRFTLPHLQTVIASYAGGMGEEVSLQPSTSDPFVQRVNAPPSDLALSATKVEAALPVGGRVGDLTTSDPNPDETHTYSLVSGVGAQDNGLFTIQGSHLQLGRSIPAGRGTVTLRIRTTDPAGLSFEKSFTLTVQRPAELPATGFAPLRLTALPPQPLDLVYEPNLGLRLVIPTLGVEAEILGVPPSGVSWDTTWLGDEVGWLSGTAFPTWQGNTGIAGHNTLADGTAGPFANLGRLVYGDIVSVQAFGDEYRYAVQSVDWVAPSDLAPLRHEENTWLTLVTCSSYDETQEAYRLRLVVRARLVEVK